MPSPKEPVRQGPPTKFAETTPPQVYPSGDYSYVLEIVMAMQNTLGKLTEAVESLKDQSKGHGTKLDELGKDVHAAKVVVTVVGGLMLLVAGFIGWITNTYISTHPAK